MSDLEQNRSASPTPSPLPPLPESDLLSAEQWGILAAISATIVPAFSPYTGNRLLQHPLRREIYESATRRIASISGREANGELVAAYLSESALDHPAFRENVSRLLGHHMDETSRNGLLFILNALK